MHSTTHRLVVNVPFRGYICCMNTEELKQRIRESLVCTGLSQHKFAVRAGLNPQTLTRYLSGATWSASTEQALAKALKRLPKRKHSKPRRVAIEVAAPDREQ
jgi:transcriptional regulator with XRE-family HTH domain